MRTIHIINEQITCKSHLPASKRKSFCWKTWIWEEKLFQWYTEALWHIHNLQGKWSSPVTQIKQWIWWVQDLTNKKLKLHHQHDQTDDLSSKNESKNHSTDEYKQGLYVYQQWPCYHPLSFCRPETRRDSCSGFSNLNCQIDSWRMIINAMFWLQATLFRSVF